MRAMGLFYVTGLSGTGKSTVLRELRARGCLARGVDEDGYADWISLVTGKADDFPRDDPDFDFHAWYAAHDWVLSRKRIGILNRAAVRLGRPVFLCGVASGDAAVWHLFEKVFALVASMPTLRCRIAARPELFGEAPEEFAEIVRWHADFEVAYRRFGAVIIDAERPLGNVVDQVLAASVGPGPNRAAGAPLASSSSLPRCRPAITLS
jgi:hypothetical protein